MFYALLACMNMLLFSRRKSDLAYISTGLELQYHLLESTLTIFLYELQGLRTP